MSKQTIYLIDDDKAILSSMATLLQAKGFFVETYDDASAFLETAGPHTSGCVVTDVRMHGMSGIELVGKLKEHGVSVPIIVITAYADLALAIEAMKSGAVDLLEKPFSNSTLVKSIEDALENRASARAGPMADATTARYATLTKREREVLSRLLKGLPNKIIAHELGVSTRTVEAHRAMVMSKMDASNLADLVRMSLSGS